MRRIRKIRFSQIANGWNMQLRLEATTFVNNFSQKKLFTISMGLRAFIWGLNSKNEENPAFSQIANGWNPQLL